MARTRQTETAVLGALSVMPMTGYAVREAIRDVLGHFWSESFGQIYPALSALERQGHVDREGKERTGSSVFVITPSGEGRLRELLAAPIQPAPPRNGLLLRLFFGRQLGPEVCQSLLENAKADAERRLTEFKAIRNQIAADEATTADHLYWLLTVSAGEHGARSVISWAEESIATLLEQTPLPVDAHE